MLKLHKVTALIRGGTKLQNASTAPMGAKAKPTNVTETDVPVGINITADAKAFEAFFPMLDTRLKHVAGLDDYAGEKGTRPEKKFQDLYVKIWYGDGEAPIVAFTAAVRGKPKLDIRKGGEAWLDMVFKGKFDSAELSCLAEHIKADVKISLELAQMDLSDATVLSEAGGATTKKPPRKTKLQAVPSQPYHADPNEPDPFTEHIS